MLIRNDWDARVKQAVNDLAQTAPEGSYAVFDWDNTCAVYDIEYQLCIYQLETMCFAIHPDEIARVLLTDMENPDIAVGENGQTLRMIAEDIADAYTALEKTCGPFDGQNRGMTDKNNPTWLEFAAKMRYMYPLVSHFGTSEAACKFPLLWFCGMTEKQIYDLACACIRYYQQMPSACVTWESPDIPSRFGRVKTTFEQGITVTDNMRELWRTLHDSGVDIYVCSASGTVPVQAAIDTFGLRPCCSGMTALNMAYDADGRQTAQYEYGGGWYTPGGATNWIQDDSSLSMMPRKEGKTQAILEGPYRRYGHGPVAGFMDSGGDFDFCTAFSSLKLVICFNKAISSVRDGGYLIAAAALMEEEKLGYDLAAASLAGDTLYVLQGRDERGLRAFRAGKETYSIHHPGELRLFDKEENERLYQIMLTSCASVRELLDTFGAVGETDGIRYGFLNEASRYRFIK